MAASGAGWLSQVGCMTIIARESVEAFSFGEEMSVSKLSDTTCKSWGSAAGLDSNMYSSIAISCLVSKIFDNIIIVRQGLVLVSNLLGSTMVIETIQCYLERNA